MQRSLSGKWTDTRTNIGQKLQSFRVKMFKGLCFAFFEGILLAGTGWIRLWKNRQSQVRRLRSPL